MHPIGIIHTYGICRQLPLCPSPARGAGLSPSLGACLDGAGQCLGAAWWEGAPKWWESIIPMGQGGLLAAFSLLSAPPWLPGEGRQGLHPTEQEDTRRQVLLPFLPWGPCSPFPPACQLPPPPHFSPVSQWWWKGWAGSCAACSLPPAAGPAAVQGEGKSRQCRAGRDGCLQLSLAKPAACRRHRPGEEGDRSQGFLLRLSPSEEQHRG